MSNLHARTSYLLVLRKNLHLESICKSYVIENGTQLVPSLLSDKDFSIFISYQWITRTNCFYDHDIYLLWKYNTGHSSLGNTTYNLETSLLNWKYLNWLKKVITSKYSFRRLLWLKWPVLLRLHQWWWVNSDGCWRRDKSLTTAGCWWQLLGVGDN